MTIAVPMKACWEADEARPILRIEALEGSRAAFKATHIPIRGFSVGGPFAHEIARLTEQGVIDALSAPERRHAFCVIEGEPGSGKSHLVRWLAVNWPAPDRPLLVQRLDGSLEGALRQLQTELPADLAYLFEKVGQRQRATLEGRAGQFAANLTEALRPAFFEQPLADVEWCKKFDPASLLYNRRVREGWTAPRRVLRLMSGAEGERNSAEARFDVSDIAELAVYEPFVRDSVKAIQLIRKIKNEAQLIQGWREAGKPVDEIEKQHKEDITFSVALASALNARRNYAVQSVLGITGEGLKRLFRELRQELKRRRARLVLLLEDITSWQGIDDSLIDALVTNAETRESDDGNSELCDLISVVGVTPSYFEKLPANYQQRITHHIRLGDRAGPLQDVASLRDRDSQVAFVARYMAAARAGKEKLEAWAEESTEGHERPPPNECVNCSFREPCHAAFGQYENVGLFPFTADAVTRLFAGLKEADGNMTWKTPRGIIQAILAPTLTKPELLEEGLYPGPEIETTKLEANSGYVAGLARSKLEAVGPDPDTRERLRRLVAYWGEKTAPQTVERTDGIVTFAAIPRQVFDAFRLPWPGEAEASARVEAKPPPPARAEADDGASSTTSSSRRQTEPKPDAPASPRPVSVSRAQLARMENDIETWRNGGDLPNPTQWNRLLARIVLNDINMRRLGIDAWLAGKLFTPSTVQIEGTGTPDTRHFIVPATTWLKDGLEAAAALESAAERTPEEEELYRRRYGALLRQLSAAASRFAAQRRPKHDDGSPWNYVATATQVLLARACLRGQVRPTAPTSLQWRALLATEVEASTAPEARTEPWDRIVDTTKNAHDKLRMILKEAVSLPQGRSNEFGIADAGTAAAALVQLQSSMALSGIPERVSQTPNWMADLALLADVGRRVAEEIPEVLPGEDALLAGRAQRVMTLIRGRSISAHVERTNSALDQAARSLPGAAPDAVQRWRQEARRLPERQVLSALEVWLSARIDEARAKPNDAAAQLDELSQAPARELYLAHTILGEGERAIEAVCKVVEAYLADGGTDEATSKTVHSVGDEILSAVKRARRVVESKP